MSEIKPYLDQESKKHQVEMMFDKIANSYDELNHILSFNIDRIWRKKMIHKIEKSNRNLICDLATGTGDVAIMLAQLINPSKIIAVDLSQGMLDLAAIKIKKNQLSDKIFLQKGDSESLNFPDNTFDAVTIAFGIRNFEHLEKGLSEMLRVVKSSGQILILEFSRPSGILFRPLMQFYFKNILPTIGSLFSKDKKAYRYLFDSVQHFPEGEELIKILNQCGYPNVKHTRLFKGICTIYECVK